MSMDDDLASVTDALDGLNARFDSFCAGRADSDQLEDAMNKKLEEAARSIKDVAKNRFNGNVEKAVQDYLSRSTFGPAARKKLYAMVGL